MAQEDWILFSSLVLCPYTLHADFNSVGFLDSEGIEERREKEESVTRRRVDEHMEGVKDE